MNGVTPLTAQLSEQHQFILACLGHAVSIVSLILMYHSSPKEKKPPTP
jgi:hypothetical protein